MTGDIGISFAEKLFHGCSAGRGFVYIKPNGDVWPCPFVPVNCGNVTQSSFLKIWSESEVFQNLRNRENCFMENVVTVGITPFVGDVEAGPWQFPEIIWPRIHRVLLRIVRDQEKSVDISSQFCGNIVHYFSNAQG